MSGDEVADPIGRREVVVHTTGDGVGNMSCFGQPQDVCDLVLHLKSAGMG